jgi:predicted permease
MKLLSSVRALLGFVFYRSRIEGEMEEELRSHLQIRADDLERQGLSRSEAGRRARVEFGGYERYKEECRDALGSRLLGEVIADARYGLRQFRRSPGFTAVAIITLALGIGANTAIFSAVNRILIRPLPFADSSQLVLLWQRVPHFGTNAFTTPDFLTWQKQTVISIAATTVEGFNVGAGSRPEHVPGSPVSGNFFSLLGVNPMLGRTFLADEDQPNGRRVVILSYGLWQRDFGSNPDVVGKTLLLNGEPFGVIGIMPRTFRNDIQPDAELWIPLESDPNFTATRQNRGVHWLLVIGRLKPGVNLSQVRGAIVTVGENLGKAYPQTDAHLGVDLFPLVDYVVGSIRPTLLILFAAVGFVLLIACANIANMLLARATARARELAVRIALGAGRARLFRQLLTESVLVAFLGGVLGLFIAYWSLDLLRALNPGNIPYLSEIGIDPKVLGFTLALCMGTGILFGVVPAYHASRTDLYKILMEGRLSSSSGSGQRHFRHLLVVSEVALALMLLVGAGLMFRSFRSLQETPLGFNPHQLLTMQITFDQPGHSEQETVSFYEQVLDRVKSLPGVESAAIARDLPLVGANPSSPFNLASHPEESPEQRPIARYRAISSGYFHTLGIPLLKGRDFTDHDNQRSTGVVIINQAMAREFWPQQNPIGEQIEPAVGASGWCTIIGIVGNDRKGGAEFPIYPTMYYPYLQVPAKDIRLIEGSMRMPIRSPLSPKALLAVVKQEVAAVNKETPIYDVRTMDEIVSDSMSGPELDTFLLGAFGLLALLMAVAGIYAVMSYSVAQRTHEIGIRVALGAKKSDVLQLVVGQGMTLALIGAGLGIVGALALTRFMSSLLYGVNPTDAATFAAAALILTGVAILACYIPARRATKVDPMVALRYE